MVEQAPGWGLVGEASDSASLLGVLTQAQPDVLLLDWELPGLPAAKLLALLRATYPPLRVIVFSGRLEAKQMALAAGADGFVSKGDPPECLLAALCWQCAEGQE